MDMKDDSTQDLQILLHPYLFVLKEGKEIRDNYLDYSLLMLRLSASEVINSPGAPKARPYVPQNFRFPNKVEANKNISAMDFQSN